MTELERCDEIREFILDNYAPASSLTPKNVDEWAAWAASKGFLFLCYDEPGDQGKLVGLCIARPLSTGRIGSEIADTDYDMDGEVVYVDLTISTAGKQTMQAMMLALMQRMGKPFLAFKRLKTKDKIKVHSFGAFANRLLGSKQYGQ